MYIPMALSLPQYRHSFRHCDFLEIDENELDTSNLQPRLVKSHKKEALLSSQSHQHRPSSDENQDAATLLSDLNRLVPSVGKGFMSKTQARNNFPLRLINDVEFGSEGDSYIAMSYCWKDTNISTPRRVITPIGDLPFGWTKEVEQFSLPTSGSIFQAVLRERTVGEGLWIDQVCINQDDKNETALTIGSIDTIYQNARTVVIALDDVLAGQEEEQFLRYYLSECDCSELPYEQPRSVGMTPPFMQRHASFRSFFERVMNSAWFERAWCAHEARMGRNHVFLIPSYKQENEEIQTVIRFTGAFFLHMLDLASEVYTTEPTYYAKIRSQHDFFSRKVRMVEEGAYTPPWLDTAQMQSSQASSIIPTISRVFSMKAGGNPRLPAYLRRLDANRDKMCISLSASGLPLALAPADAFSRPNTEDECLRSLLLVGLAARDPVALCTTGAPLQLHDGSISWLFRPTPLDVNASRPVPPRMDERASQITQSSDGRAEYAQLDLLFLDIPHRSQPNAFFPTHVQRACMLVDICIQYEIQVPGLWNFWQTPQHPRSPALRNIFIQVLACVFSCGPQWLLDVSTTLEQPQMPAMDPYAINMLLNTQLVYQNYLALAEGQTAVKSLLRFASAVITSGIPWASGASERTHGPMIVCSPAPSSSTSSSSSTTPQYTTSSDGGSTGGFMSSPPLLSHIPSGKALIFAPFAHSKTLLIALPDVVKDPEYETLARGWILTTRHPYTGSAKPAVSWTLQSKGVVFGDLGFKAGLAACGREDVRNHRVYGPFTK